MRNTNQLPLHLCLAGGLVGGLVGSVASEMAWLALGGFLWMPYWQQLRDHGMSADDNGWAIGAVFVPPIIGVAFLISTLVSLITLRWIDHPKLVLVALNLVPGLWLILNGFIGFHYGRYWEFPGFEIVCLLIGFGWGTALYMFVLRRSSYIEG